MVTTIIMMVTIVMVTIIKVTIIGFESQSMTGIPSLKGKRWQICLPSHRFSKYVRCVVIELLLVLLLFVFELVYSIAGMQYLSDGDQAKVRQKLVSIKQR